jgi:hypothetical protein
VRIRVRRKALRNLVEEFTAMLQETSELDLQDICWSVLNNDIFFKVVLL